MRDKKKERDVSPAPRIQPAPTNAILMSPTLLVRVRVLHGGGGVRSS
jgi:hypothetical protein